MGIYYIAGVPYSDELYHHGIIGQKWGVRRYQNRDGSLTAEGRQHYGVKSSKNKVTQAIAGAGRVFGTVTKKTGAAVGKAASATAKYAVERFKMHHPSLLSNEELSEYTRRLVQENTYNDMVKKMNSSNAARVAVANATKFVGDIMLDGSKTLAQAGFKRIANEITETETSKENRYLDNEIKRLDLDLKVRSREVNDKLTDMDKKQLRTFTRIINDPSATPAELDDAYENLKKYTEAVSAFRPSGGKKR